MKIKMLGLILFLVISTSCISTKNTNSDLRYFDVNNVEIKKGKFLKIRSTNKFIDIRGKNENTRFLIQREERGEVSNVSKLYKKLNVEKGNPVVIIYRPSIKKCKKNTASNEWYKKMEFGINKLTSIKPKYILQQGAKVPEKIDFLNWENDPEGIVEAHFFKHPYPCSSFVVLSETGAYISYFGEFSKEFVWKALEHLTLPAVDRS